MKGQTRKVTDKNDDNDTASQRTDGTQKGDTQCTARSEYKTQSTQNNPMTWHRDSHVMTLCDWHVMASRLLWCHDIGAWQNNYFPLPRIPEFFPYPDVPDLEVSANPLTNATCSTCNQRVFFIFTLPFSAHSLSVVVRKTRDWSFCFPCTKC